MSWHFSQALVAEYSGAASLDGEQSVQSSTTPTPAAYFWPDKTTEHSRLSRFGMTCEPLTDDRGEAMLTLFLAGFHAKTSVLPARGLDSTASEADSGLKWQGSFARYNPAMSTWKTAQFSLLADSDEFLETWPKWGSMRNGASYLRPIPAPLNSVSESGLWRTPSASVVEPKSTVVKLTGRKPSDPQVGLADQVGGPLNPTWVEWLMGWPQEWTDLKPLETAKFQEWLKLHGRY